MREAMTITNLTIFLSTTLLLLTNAAPPLTGRNLSPDELVEYYQQYDVTTLQMGFIDTPDACDYEENQYNHCPKDQVIPCSPIDLIETFCKDNLGKDIVESMETVESGNGLNAVTGCVKYVGYHVVEHGHYACCDSAVCDKFINEQIEDILLELNDDDEDDHDYEDDDDYEVLSVFSHDDDDDEDYDDEEDAVFAGFDDDDDDDDDFRDETRLEF
jgi:hypothetical protein